MTQHKKFRKRNKKNNRENLVVNWADPLKDLNWSLPIGKYSPGGFGYKRNHSVHTGVDLYCPEGTNVYAAEAGKIVGIEVFTGPRAESEWYNETYAILIEGHSGVIAYCEIEPEKNLLIGDFVVSGDKVGSVLSVLKEDKGNGTSMLHFELYCHNTKQTCWWLHNSAQPKQLLDPTQYLLSLKVSKR